MQSTDREEFETQLARLCAGFNVPVTTHRVNAYWSGLGKLSVAQFSRVIDWALGEDGPDDIPSTKGIWKCHRDLRGVASAKFVQTSARDMSTPDHLEYFANRLLFQHLTHRGGLGSGAHASAELRDCLEFKRELVTEWLPYLREGDELATPAEFVRRWLVGLRRISRIDKPELDGLQALAADPRSLTPFGVHMGRELAPVQQQAAFA